ncbi:MAG: EamA family transporter [Austwickia sp.]|nr:EamA family transporter [Austwickia sp.]
MTTLAGPLLALASALAYGVADFAGGMLSRRRPAVAVVGVSQACSLVALVVIVAVVGLPGNARWLPWSILAGVAGATGLTCFYRALAYGTVGVVSPISALGVALPVIVGLAGGEQPAGVQLAGLVLALVGAVLASGPELRGEHHVKSQAVWFAVAAAVGFGLALLAIARGSAYSPLMTMTGMRATSVTGFAILALVTRSVGGIRPRELPALAALGLADIGANLLIGVATTLALLSVSAVLSALYPVVTVALAAVILHERMRPIQVMGTILALVGVLLIAVPAG